MHWAEFFQAVPCLVATRDAIRRKGTQLLAPKLKLPDYFNDSAEVTQEELLLLVSFHSISAQQAPAKEERWAELGTGTRGGQITTFYKSEHGAVVSLPTMFLELFLSDRPADFDCSVDANSGLVIFSNAEGVFAKLPPSPLDHLVDTRARRPPRPQAQRSAGL